MDVIIEGFDYANSATVISQKYEEISKEISLLTEIVEKIDPHAFIIINNVHEVLGQGFRPRI